MPQSPDPETVSPPPDDPRGRSDRQDTVVLNDLPAATVIAPETSPSPAVVRPSAATLASLQQRYDILGEAGAGSMGQVYKARDRETGETLALKLLKPEIASDQAMMERFKNELLFARKITHKHVCRVYEFNRLGGIVYTSMEFVEGESLRSVLNRFGGLPVRKGIDLALQICAGLKEAHAQGIVHRDLKPENIMIDTQGNVKIMDFGIARSMEALTRLTGAMAGTPAYMAPEQVGGKAVDYRTDVYAVGLLLYEIFTGKPAFQADNTVAVALKQMRESPTPPCEIEPSIPVPLERIILRCLEKEPSRRFQSVAQLEDALRASPAAPAIRSVSAAAVLDAPSRVALRPSATPVLSAGPTRGARHVSPLVWILLGASLVWGSLAGWHWVQTENLLAASAPPAPLPAPLPPDFALQTSAAEQPAPDQAAGGEPPAPASPAAASTDAKSPAPASVAATEPAKPAPQTSADTTASAKPEPAGNRPVPRAQPSPREAARKQAEQPQGESSSLGTAADNPEAPSYLWIGRFEREEVAQDTSRKIEDLGLPVMVMPRLNNGTRFFLVLTGPFDADRVQSVKEWLQTQGFYGVRQIRLPLPNRNPNAAPNP